MNTREELQIINLTYKLAEIKDEVAGNTIPLAFIFDVDAFSYIIWLPIQLDKEVFRKTELYCVFFHKLSKYDHLYSQNIG